MSPNWPLSSTEESAAVPNHAGQKSRRRWCRPFSDAVPAVASPRREWTVSTSESLEAKREDDRHGGSTGRERLVGTTRERVGPSASGPARRTRRGPLLPRTLRRPHGRAPTRDRL